MRVSGCWRFGRLLMVPLVWLALAPAGRAEIAAPPPMWGLDDTPAGNATDLATERFEAGAEALRRGDLDTAQQAFMDSREANPRMPQPLVGLADIEQRRGRAQHAQKLLDQALELAPGDAAVLTARAAFHIRRQDYGAAETELKTAIEANPKDLRAHLALADLYGNLAGRPTDAAAAWRASIAIDPVNAPAHHGLGLALAATGQFQAAEEELKRSAALAPTSPVPLHALARLQLRQGQVDAGTQSLDAALKIEPGFVPALVDKGDVMLASGKSDEALAIYERAVAADTASAVAQFKRGAALQVLGRTKDATGAYLAALEIDPQLAPALNNLAWLAIGSGDDLNLAAARAAKAVELVPDNAGFRDTLGWVYRAQRRWSEAETVLEKAASMPPRMASVQYHLAMVYLDQKKTDMARKALAEALGIDPKHADSKATLNKLGSEP